MNVPTIQAPAPERRFSFGGLADRDRAGAVFLLRLLGRLLVERLLLRSAISSGSPNSTSSSTASVRSSTASVDRPDRSRPSASSSPTRMGESPAPCPSASSKKSSASSAGSSCRPPRLTSDGARIFAAVDALGPGVVGARGFDLRRRGRRLRRGDGERGGRAQVHGRGFHLRQRHFRQIDLLGLRRQLPRGQRVPDSSTMISSTRSDTGSTVGPASGSIASAADSCRTRPLRRSSRGRNRRCPACFSRCRPGRPSAAGPRRSGPARRPKSAARPAAPPNRRPASRPGSRSNPRRTRPPGRSPSPPSPPPRRQTRPKAAARRPPSRPAARRNRPPRPRPVPRSPPRPRPSRRGRSPSPPSPPRRAAPPRPAARPPRSRTGRSSESGRRPAPPPPSARRGRPDAEADAAATAGFFFKDLHEINFGIRRHGASRRAPPTTTASARSMPESARPRAAGSTASGSSTTNADRSMPGVGDGRSRGRRLADGLGHDFFLQFRRRQIDAGLRRLHRRLVRGQRRRFLRDVGGAQVDAGLPRPGRPRRMGRLRGPGRGG